jgi:hypothetical protein
MRIDYGRQNGERGFIQTVSLRRDVEQAKVPSCTTERIHLRDSREKIAAITEAEPTSNNSRREFVQELFAEQNIQIVPMNHAEAFAEQLRT